VPKGREDNNTFLPDTALHPAGGKLTLIYAIRYYVIGYRVSGAL